MPHSGRLISFVVAVALGAGIGARVGSAQAPDVPARDRVYDELVDMYVRDGMVYYRALKSVKARLDQYVASLAGVQPERLSRDAQVAFWLNAYNAVVLQTVADRYPIPKRSDDYPPGSIRQIPGAFERVTHRVGGRSLTLDQIEQEILVPFGDPRVFLALGRGAIGSGRLRSEAYTAERLEIQLASLANDCPGRAQCLVIDPDQGTVAVSSVFSWREPAFVAAYADRAPEVFGSRSSIERAVLAFIQPKLLSFERTFLDRNMFRLRFLPFDWSLNDLTGR